MCVSNLGNISSKQNIASFFWSICVFFFVDFLDRFSGPFSDDGFLNKNTKAAILFQTACLKNSVERGGKFGDGGRKDFEAGTWRRRSFSRPRRRRRRREGRRRGWAGEAARWSAGAEEIWAKCSFRHCWTNSELGTFGILLIFPIIKNDFLHFWSS